MSFQIKLRKPYHVLVALRVESCKTKDGKDCEEEEHRVEENES